MSGRGWKSDGLKVVGDDDRYWTVAQAAALLGPPRLTVAQVRQLVQMRNIQPVGKRRVSSHGTAGRYPRVYLATDFIEAFEALSR